MRDESFIMLYSEPTFLLGGSIIVVEKWRTWRKVLNFPTDWGQSDLNTGMKDKYLSWRIDWCLHLPGYH